VTAQRRFLIARLGYVAIVLLATLSQLDFSPNLADASMRLQRAFVLSLHWRDAIDGLRNAVLFAGLGVVWVTASLTGDVRREIRLATLTSLLLSTAIEACQVFSPVRTASLVDVTTDTLGGLGGAIATALLIISVRNARQARSYLGIPMLMFAGPYVLAVLCEALTPLFQSNDLPGNGGPVDHFITSLQTAHLGWTPTDVFDVPLFVAAGFLLVALARERRGTAATHWAAIAAMGAITIAGVHVAHGALRLPLRWGAVIIDGASIALGAWFAERWLSDLTQRLRGSARARATLIAYTALLLVWAWRPFVPETRLDAIAVQLNTDAFIPLAGLSVRVDTFSAVHVAQQFLLYLPLGALLAVWPLRTTGRWATLWPAVGLAVVIEMGHIVIVDRTFDVTNALLACAALATGWTVVRRCGYRPYGAAMAR
jgi:glycopeptide antibiotics resistance protein